MVAARLKLISPVVAGVLLCCALSTRAGPAEDQLRAYIASHAQPMGAEAAKAAEQQLVESIRTIPGGQQMLDDGLNLVLGAADLGFPGLGAASGLLMGALFPGQTDPTQMRLDQLERRMAVTEHDVDTLKQFAVFIAAQVHETQAAIDDVVSTQDVVNLKHHVEALKVIRSQSRSEQQRTINDMAIDAQQFLPDDFQTVPEFVNLGTRRWYMPMLIAKYSRTGGLSWTSKTAFYPDIALETYVKLLIVLANAEQTTGLKASASAWNRQKHVEFLTASAEGVSLPLRLRDVSCTQSFSARTVDNNGRCEVTSTCRRFTTTEVVTPVVKPPPRPGESVMCTASPNMLPDLDAMKRDLLEREAHDPTIDDVHSRLAQAAAARLAGATSWPPPPGSTQVSFDYSRRNFEGYSLYAVDEGGSLVQFAVEHFEQKAECRRPGGNMNLCALRAQPGPTWAPVHRIKEIARVSGQWAGVKSAGSLGSSSGTGSSELDIIAVRENGEADWSQLAWGRNPPGRCQNNRQGLLACNVVVSRNAVTSTSAPLNWPGLQAVFSGGLGLIYAIDSQGYLNWIYDQTPGQSPVTSSKFLNSSQSAQPCHAAGSPGNVNRLAAITRNCNASVVSPSSVRSNRIGEGWGAMISVASAGRGVIYALGSNGTLYWFKHTLYQNDAQPYTATRWVGPVKLREDWAQYRHMAADASGGLYVVSPAGELFYIRHLDPANGAPQLAEPVLMASGWGRYRAMFVVNESSLRESVLH